MRAHGFTTEILVVRAARFPECPRAGGAGRLSHRPQPLEQHEHGSVSPTQSSAVHGRTSPVTLAGREAKLRAEYRPRTWADCVHALIEALDQTVVQDSQACAPCIICTAAS